MPVVPSGFTGTPSTSPEFITNLYTYLGLTTPLEPELDAKLTLAQSIAENAINHFLQNELNYKLHEELGPIGEWNIDKELVEYPTDISGSGQAPRYDAVFTTSMKLNHTPVHYSGLEVWVDWSANANQSSDPFPALTKLTPGVDYYLDVDNPTDMTSKSGVLYLAGGLWPRVPRSVKVKYYAGFTNMPYALQEAFFLTILHVLTRMDAASKIAAGGGPSVGKALTSESVPDYSWSATQDSARFGAVTSSSLPDGVTWLLWPYKNYKYVD